MRIRKRWPLLSPTPPAARPDLLSSDSREVYRSPADNKNLNPICDPSDQYQPPEKEVGNHRRRSDLELVTVTRTDGWIFSTADDDLDMHLRFNKEPPIGVVEKAGAAEESRLPAANQRFRYKHSPETSSENGHWCEEDRTIPLKKRKVSFQKSIMEKKEEKKEKESKTKKVKARRKQKPKWVDSEDDDDDDDKEEEREIKGGKKMEGGSRCTRINGRGWRCREQPLVGYSLCEHHLGKGRLKSMNTVRRQRPKPEPKKIETSWYNEEEEEEETGDEKGKVDVKKREKKNGLVKARSISSLLGQTVPLSPPVRSAPSNDATNHVTNSSNDITPYL